MEATKTRDAIVRFLRRTALAHARRIEQLSYGFAALVPELPRAYDLNLVWVDAYEIDAAALIAEGERLAKRHGYEHCELLVPDVATTGRLAPALAAAGYEAERRLLMVARRPPDRHAAHPVEEIDLPTIEAFTEATLREGLERFDEETIRQLCAAKRIVAASGGRFLATRAADGTVAAACEVYTDGTIAQVESLVTLVRYRGRGYARSLVLHAVQEARASSHELVFLQADGDDWPRHLYARLGFDPVGCVTRFLRTESVPR